MFKILFDDGTQFSGESLPVSQWKKVPEKTIIGMQYKVGNKVFILHGFKQYNHLIENVVATVNIPKHPKIFIMARNNTETYILTLNLIEAKIYHNVTKIGDEYGKQVLTGWKDGVLIGKGVVSMKDLKADTKTAIYPTT